MIPHHVYYQLVRLVLLWLCLMLPHLWPSPPGVAHKIPTQSIKSKRKRSREPKPFAGLTHKPHCAHIPLDLVVDSCHHMLRVAQPLISR